MGRAPCCSKVGLHRGPWTPREDTLLTKYIQAHGEGHWRSLPKKAGLLRCGKSCRLRWMNYLRPDIKRGNITSDEDDLIVRMHSLLGNRWSLIAGRLPGRTDNEIKNYWNTHLSKKLRSQGTDPDTHKKLSESPKRQPNKRKRNNINKKHNKKNTKKPTEPVKPKIHLPKPVRFTTPPLLSLPRNESFDCNTISTTLSCSQEEEMGNIPLADEDYYNNEEEHNHGISFLVGDPDQSCSTSNNSDNIEKLYEEYLQLLNTVAEDHDDQMELDSFAESLLL